MGCIVAIICLIVGWVIGHLISGTTTGGIIGAVALVVVITIVQFIREGGFSKSSGSSEFERMNERISDMTAMKQKWILAGAKCSNCDKRSFCSDRSEHDYICVDYEGRYRDSGDAWRRG